MPLVTLTCNEKYYPTDDMPMPDNLLRVSEWYIVQLANQLPMLIVNHAGALHLDADTPQEAVQVDIQKFHAYSVNSPDIWIHIVLTEEMGDANRQLEIRNVLRSILNEWFIDHNLRLSWALDVFFGPGHGCFTDRVGNIIQNW